MTTPLLSSMNTDASQLLRLLRARPPAEVLALVDGAVKSLVARLFQVSFLQVTGETVLSSYGLDSMRAMELRNLIYSELGIEVPATVLLSGATLRDVIDEIARQIHAGPESLAPLAEAASGSPPPAERLPLSFGQERLWFLHQLDPSSTAYNLAGAAWVTGPISAEAVERCIGELIRRHESLRTVFGDEAGVPYRRVLPEISISVPVVDLAAVPGAEQDRLLHERVAAEERQPFDLTRGPLLRLTLVELGAGRRALVLGIHHLIADGSSLSLLMHELALLLAGREQALPELPVQYSDYVAWQRRLAGGPQHERSLRYWLDQLGGELPVLELPADRPRPSIEREDGVSRSLRLPEELGRGLRALAARHQTTLFTVLLSAFEVLLYRYSGQTDLLIGTPVAGRPRLELSPVIGFFADTLVLRADLSGRPTFREVLDRTRRRVLDALDHQRVPLGQIVAAMHPDPQGRRASLFSAMFTVNRLLESNAHVGIDSGAGDSLELRQLLTESRTARSDLDLAVTEQRDGLTAVLECRADLFEGETVLRILEHYRVLLEAVVETPDLEIARLPLLPRAEEERILALSRPPAGDPAPDAIASFQAQAARTPQATAVRCGAEALTYRELDDRADRIARGLREAGVAADDVVAILAHRGTAFVTSVLGVLKAGCAWLVLDPQQPAPRLARMAEEIAPRAVLATERCAGEARQVVTAARSEVPLHSIEALLCAPGMRVPPASGPSRLAYAIFTSGTTGIPRAALVQRGSLDHHLHAFARQLELTAGDRIAQHAPHSFDATIWQILAPLTVGAELHVIPDEEAAEPDRLYRALLEQRITLLDVVPALLEALLDAARSTEGARPMLRRVVVGGDVLPVNLVRRWLARFPGIPLLNAYGPSECTDVTTVYDVTAPPPPEQTRLPIGRPRPGSAAYVLDEEMRLAPLGVPGELYLGGIGVGRGYARRSRRTAAQFLPDPLGTEPGARLYRTGDVARWRADGQLEFLGRRDRQVKVHGARVELGDIEAHLRALPGVRDAVVLASGEGERGPRLVAYVVPVPDLAARPAPDALRCALAEVLPAYMVPAIYVELDALPLTAVGKLDVHALQALSAAARAADTDYEAPRDEAEQAIAAIWEEVLGVPRVGVRDDFFALGGHSLLAARVVSRVRDRFQRDVPLRHLFAFSTLSELARAVMELEPSRPASAISRVPRGGRLPLSYAQQRLWFLQELDPADTSYHVHGALLLDGPLQIEALARSLEAVVERHEALRTSFGDDRGAPYQVIHDRYPIEIGRIDVRAEGAPIDAARRWLKAEAHRPFDLARPLVRVNLVQVASERHLLGVCLHHLIVDGWSIALFAEELGRAYTALVRGEPLALPTLEIHCADHAVWQMARMESGALAGDLAYWRSVFEHPVTPLQLPVDRPPPATRAAASGGARVGFTVDAGTLAGIQALCEREGASLFMFLFAAFNALLHHYTGAEDITIGTPVAGRSRPELEGVIGCFVNTLALRTDLSGRPTFRELLRRVRDRALEAYEHQELPFEKLVEEVHPERDPGRNPLFQVAFALQNTRAWRADFQGVRATPFETRVTAAKFDLFLETWEDEGRLHAAFEYPTHLFDAQTVARFAGHFATLLASIVETPDQRLLRLSILPEAERRLLLAEWNGHRVDFHIETAFASLFERQAARTPNATAVVCESARLSYGELNRQSNRVAHFLAAQGARAEQVVALLDERDVRLLVSTLGVFKAGGAYLPLDPRHPTARHVQILSQSGSRIFLCGRALEAEARAAIAELGGQAPALHVVDDILATCHREDDPAPRSQPGHLAYVIFTSGTTGVPKGAMIDQRGMLNHLHSKVLTLGLREQDVLLQDASQCFDISVWQLLAALLVGGQVAIVKDDVARDPARLYRALDEHGITVMEVVPSLLRALLDVIHAGGDHTRRLARLRQVVSNAETLPPEMQREWLSLYPHIPLFNTYGATECSDDVSIVCLDQPAPRHRDRLPVGQPVGNMQVYALNRELDLAPIGVPGELYIGGVAVGRGYFNRPELTAASFLPDPFSAVPGARIYRTGDLGRYTSDGQIDFLGRQDDQVKIRGNRVELSEIEARLAEHPLVKHAVVLARSDGGADRELVAYVVASSPEPGVVDALRAALRQQLPSYMVPALFMVMERFPVSRNGKIDRAALPRPTREQLRDESGFVAPRDERERYLAAVWADVLKVERVGIHDNFFDLGGHSLLATQVIARLRDHFQRDLPLRSLFQHPSIAELARHALGGPGAPAGQDALVPAPRGDELPLSFAQQRFWFLAQLEPNDPSYNVHYALRLDGPVDVAAIEHSVGVVIARHESLRTSFIEVNGIPLQRIHDRLEFAIDTVDLQTCADPEGEASRRIELEAERPFDLARLPLLRITLLRTGPQTQVLFLNMHHIICDGWSMGVFIQEVGQCYAAFLEGRAPELPALPIQSYDHAVWQRRRLENQSLEPQLQYWRGMLGRDIPYLELPVDFPRPRVQGHRGAKLELSLGPELSAAIHALCRREGVTLYMVMLAALATMLHRVTHSRDLTIGSPIAGRNRPELEGLIGCFINTLVLRVELSDRLTFRQLLAQVRQRTLDAYDHQDLPFEKIVEEVLQDRDLGSHPLFQVMLVLHNLFGAKVSMPGVDSRHFAYESRTAKFDLLLALWETGPIIEGEWEYRTDLFAPATVQRLHDIWVHLLRGVTAEPGALLDSYLLQSEVAARSELAERNRTDRPLPETGLFPEIFARRARQYGDRVAAVCDGQSLSYAALDARSNQIAHALRAQGLAPESVVALMLDRGLDLLAAVLGVWKAGCAYLPVDLSHPDRRIASVLEEAGARVALTSRAACEKAAGLLPASRVLVVEDVAATAPATEASVQLAPLQLAYVIFTSGSTGVPKGAMLHHLGLINHLFAKALDLGLGEHDVVAQIAVQTFDVSIWQMFAALLVGGRTVILTGDDAWEPRRLFRQIQAAGITTVQSVPAHMKAMLAELEAAPGAHDLSSLRWLIMNGEGLPPDLCRRWFARWPSVPMINMYGLTECSDDSCHYHIPPALPQHLSYMPINGTLMNHKIYVVDDALRPTPAGLVGELCIGGIGVGRGYIRDPRRTAQAFVPDPFSSVPGARMYRTGDQVRYLADGSLVFIERLDHQIKLRGRRIDVGEIEAALREHPQLRDAAVKAFTADGGYARLVAYLVSRVKPAPLLSNIVLHLQERVPEYMVPSDFVYLEQFPLTDNGKLDRSALSAPARSEGSLAAHRPPVTETQQAIARIWSELLGIPAVGLDDHYFALGGHSLAAAEMTTRVKKRFQIDVPMRAVFETPVLETYVERIEQLRATSTGPAAAERDFEPAGATREVYDLAPQQIPEWYAYTLDPTSAVYNVCLTLFLDGEIDRSAFVETWNLLLARHQVFQTRFEYRDGKPVQRCGPQIALRPEDVFLDHRHVPDSDVRDDGRAVADRLGNQVFDLERGPLFRVRLVSYPGQRHLLVFVIHHIVWDETSTINMIKEFSRNYNARITRQPIAAPPRRLDYLDYAQQMHDAVHAGAFGADRAYWLSQFASAPPALALPTDHPRPSILTYEGSTVDCWLPREISGRLQAYLLEHNVTLFMFLLAVLDMYLYRITGNDDVVVGCPIANREHDALRDMLGLFAVPLPLRARMHEQMRFSELLRQVSEVAVDGYEHHRYPSTLLIEELALPKDLSRPRLFSVMYGVQNNKTSVLDNFHLEGIRISLDDQIHGPEWSTARFDLTFVVDQFGDDISLAVNFNTRLFKRATAERMMRHIVHLTGQVLTAPDQALWDYPLMPAAEAEHMLTSLNQTCAPFAEDLTIAHMFARRATASPGEIAIVAAERSWSYAELARRAGQIGGTLAARGVGRGARVAVLLAPSFDMLAAMLGILDCGAAYVPLLPEHPESRLQAILADAGIRWAISSSEHRGKLVAGDATVLCPDDLAPGTGEASELAVRAQPGDVAYVIYTSGTTGAPKGIEIEHRGLVNYLEFLQREYQLDGRDCVLLATSHVFDASVVETFWPLAYGARVAIAASDERGNPAVIAQLMRNHGVSVLQGVPPFLAAVAEAHMAPPERLRLTISGGAALNRETRDKLLRVFPGRLMNHYGPTEVTVDASTFDCSREFDGSIVPIGRPISNVSMFILDRRLRPVPPGVPGEIYVASPGLARGYLGDPQRTSRAFVSHAVDGPVPPRLYRTGDLGRYDADGTIYYLGRIDKQVKIRGNRVELEEIIARLHAHTDVADCAVVAMDRGTTSERLAAYIELSEANNGFVAKGETYQLFTLEQRPELLHRIEAAYLSSWPAFFAGARVTSELWLRIGTEFPDHQFALVDEADEVVATGNAVPTCWNGEPSSLPSGWDDALARALGRDRSVPPDTLLILTGAVVASHQGRGLSACVLDAFKALARAYGYARAVVPVRPAGKADRPDLSFAEWCEARRPDGAAIDPSLRIHQRAGGTAIRIEPRSQRVFGSLAQWEEWTGRTFSQSGEHHVAGGLAPVHIDLERGLGEYYEPGIWYQHSLEPYHGPAWRPLDRQEIRAYLAEALPDYMVPDLFCFLARLPRGPSGKIDEQRLPLPPQQAGKTPPPQTPLQLLLAELFREVLGATGVGIGDDFFHLGGQSLLAIELLALIGRRLGVSVDLRDFYREPTIQGLERLVARLNPSGTT
jgi:amino acid adenylation domain-containing protein